MAIANGGNDMDKNEVLKILETAKDKNGEVPMRLVRQAFEKLPKPCEDTISRQAAIDAVHVSYDEIFDFKSTGRTVADSVEDIISDLPSAQPDRKLIDDYMWKIKQNISPHTAAEGAIAIKYYLEQIYEQIYGEGEKPKWMT